MGESKINLELLKRIIIKDRNGKIRYDSGLKLSHSSVKNFIGWIYGEFEFISYVMTDTGGTSRTMAYPGIGPAPNYRNYIDAPANNDNYGIVIGSGTSGETINDYALDTQIAHGTGAGQLQYSTHSIVKPTIVSDNVDFVFSRAFINGSGNDVVVREIGVYTLGLDTGSTFRYICVIRDILSSAETVANGETLTIQYTIRTTI